MDFETLVIPTAGKVFIESLLLAEGYEYRDIYIDPEDFEEIEKEGYLTIYFIEKPNAKTLKKFRLNKSYIISYSIE